MSYLSIAFENTILKFF